MSLTIEAGSFYKTRCGLKARIYATDCHKVGYSGLTAHGAIFSYGEWNFREWWLSDGKDAIVEKEPEFDLVAPWIDPPVVDWDKLPSYIVAMAMNESGDWYGFTAVRITPHGWSWDYEDRQVGRYQGKIMIFTCDYPKFSGDWRDSLAIRPGHEEGKK